MNDGKLRKSVLASVAALLLLPSGYSLAQQPKTPPAGSAAAAGEMADFFRQVGDQIYEDCIFELSQEQLEVQQALIEAYIKQGATGTLARQLAVTRAVSPRSRAACPNPTSEKPIPQRSSIARWSRSAASKRDVASGSAP